MSAAQVRALFGKQTLYEILGVDKKATAEQIKRAYFKKALLWHPDKAGDDPEATKKFQALSFVHSILSDPGKRKEYDKTGSMEDADDGDSESADAWFSYWRTMFPPVTEEQIAEFEKSYRFSAEEAGDVLSSYVACGGDMDSLLDAVMCCTAEDTDRFVAIIHEGIKDGKVPALKRFTDLYGAAAGQGPSKRGATAAKRAQLQRVTKAQQEAEEAEQMLAEMRAAHKEKHGSSSSGGGGGKRGGAHGGAGSSSEPSLADMILAKRQDRMNSVIASLEAKYAKGGSGSKTAGKGGKGKRKAAESEDEDEEDDGDDEEDDDDDDEEEEDSEEEEGAARRKKQSGVKRKRATFGGGAGLRGSTGKRR